MYDLLEFRNKGSPMQGPKKKRWQELCERASTEQDPDELLKLIDQINRMLWEKEQNLKEQRKAAGQ